MKSASVKKEVKKDLHIPFRYILSVLIMVLETAGVLSIMFILKKYVPGFRIAIVLTEIFVVIGIVNSEDNPDYKLPWLIFVLAVPVVGFMIYFMYYSRNMSRKFSKRLSAIQDYNNNYHTESLEALRNQDKYAYNQALQLCKMTSNRTYSNTKTQYFSVGEKMFESMLVDLKNAERFIFMEYFLIEKGFFWDSILEILKEKAASGVEIKLMYDDIGCMAVLPGNYYKTLGKMGIECVPFAMLKGQANNEFNNRTHRKIMVIDGKVAYTGGVNIADEYINRISPFGHWKDTGLRLEGDAVRDLTMLFLGDYALNAKKVPNFSEYEVSVPSTKDGYIIPFGSGPTPMYKTKVGQTVIENMLNQAKDYVYITTPYLIIDNQLTQTIVNAAMRGVDVRIITPHIPDKKIIFGMTRSSYKRLIENGVRIYEYEPGFIHAKMYVSDDTTAMIGTINLDYRSLVHHFENGVWLYRNSSVLDIKNDVQVTMNKSLEIKEDTLKNTLIV